MYYLLICTLYVVTVNVSIEIQDISDFHPIEMAL